MNLNTVAWPLDFQISQSTTVFKIVFDWFYTGCEGIVFKVSSIFESKFIPPFTTHSLLSTMDALGTAVNVASIIDLSAKSVNVLFRYLQDVARADTNLQSVKERLSQDAKTFRNFKALGEYLKDHHSQCDSPGKLHDDLVESISEMQSQDLDGDLNKFIRWLDHQGGKGESSKGPDGDEMSLVQRLKWPLYGKRKVRRFIPKMTERKNYMIFIVLIILRFFIFV